MAKKKETKKTRKEKYAPVLPVLSVWNQWNRWISFIALIGSILLGYGISLETSDSKYWQLQDILMYVLAFGIIIMFAFYLFSMKSIEITEHQIIIKNYFHKEIRTIAKSEILGYYEDINIDKHDIERGRTLRIKTTSKPLTVRNYNYTNYEKLRTALTYGIKKDMAGEVKSAKKWALGFGVSMIIFSTLVVSYSAKEFSSDPLTKDDYVFIERTLKQIEFETHRSSKNSTSYSLSLKLKENSDFIFKMSDNIWSKEALKLTSQFLSAGDSISIAIRKDDYQKKISQTIPLNFWDKHNHYSSISFVAASKEESIILDLATYIQLKNKPLGLWSYLGFGLIILVFLSGCLLIYLVFEGTPTNKES